jgi:hypothetical protein
MHKYSKQEFEEQGDLFSKKIMAVANKLKTSYNNILEKLHALHAAPDPWQLIN